MSSTQPECTLTPVALVAIANRRDLAVDLRPVAAQHCGWGLQTGFCSQISYWEFLKKTFHSHQESISSSVGEQLGMLLPQPRSLPPGAHLPFWG